MIEAIGRRIGWLDLPAPVRARIEAVIGGGPVVEARSQAGGFSPGTADRVCTADGRRAFVKAVHPAINTQSAEMARREMQITAALPAHAPVPRMLGGFETDGENDGGWVVLILQDVEGAHPRTPWVESEIDAAGTALAELAAALTPAPLTGLPTAADRLAANFTGWESIAADPPPDLDRRAADRLDDLRAASACGLTAVAGGATLTHCDLRADNILVRPDGRMIFVDWPWACVGPAWLDTVELALNIVVHGGDPARLLAGVDPQVVTEVAAGFTGFFLDACRLPPPPGIPTVRAFQRSQGDALLPWLLARLPETTK